MEELTLDGVRAELAAWRYEWFPALVLVAVLVAEVFDWGAGPTLPWIVASVGLWYLAWATRRARSRRNSGSPKSP